MQISEIESLKMTTKDNIKNKIYTSQQKKRYKSLMLNIFT